MPDYEFLQFESLDEGRIVRILLDRPDTRNAQNRGLLVELDDAFRRAEEDDEVRVVILGGTGPLFSSGHDMGSAKAQEERVSHPTTKIDGATRAGAEARMLQEWHYYFQNTLRWRNLRKITVAQVQGTVYAAGLMLMWACDLIVGAENVLFADVVGTRLGMCGIEYFGHPWEFGARKTKELMLTGDAIDVHEAHRLGMVSKVFPTDELDEQTLAFARRIAELPTMTALLIKESVNQTVDSGRSSTRTTTRSPSPRTASPTGSTRRRSGCPCRTPSRDPSPRASRPGPVGAWAVSGCGPPSGPSGHRRTGPPGHRATGPSGHRTRCTGTLE
jgi:enoyl-CoA hydratase